MRQIAGATLVVVLAVVPACEQGVLGTAPGPGPVGGEVDEAALAGTHWTSTLPGSLGTYVTWFSFGSEGLDVTLEVRDAVPDGADGVQWVSHGAWEVGDDGVVSLTWEEDVLWDHEPIAHIDRWTYTAPSPQLAEHLAPGPHPFGPPWLDAVLRATDATGTSFRGTWHSEEDGPTGVFSQSRSVALDFAEALEVGATCDVAVHVAVERVDPNAGVESGEATFEWSCRVVEETALGLARVEIGPFVGTQAEISQQWWAAVWPFGQSDRVTALLHDAFFPVLWLDPAQPGILAFEAGHVLLERDEGPPPELVEPAADGALFSDCTEDAECASGFCYRFWDEIDGEWVQDRGLCSFETFDAQDPGCLAGGGTLYMPGCAPWYCLPACDTDADCTGERTCGTDWADWNEPACGYW